MIQETNELMLGIELNEQYAQITYYHQSVREPMTLGASSNSDHALLPMGMRPDSHGRWHLWDGKSAPADGVADLYGRISRQETVSCGGRSYSPAELLSVYFQLCLSKLKLASQDVRLHVMVTVRRLDDVWSAVIVEALEKNGLDRKQIYVQDFFSSFYYHTINQKKELWYQDVALLTYEDEAIVGYVLHIDRSTRPAIAAVNEIARQPMGRTCAPDAVSPSGKRKRTDCFSSF